MTSPHRIIAADSSRLVPDIVRATVDLVERSVVVIEVRSGETALAEVKRGDVDLLVSGFTLDDMRGFELALKATQHDQQLPVLILASANDPAIDDETQAESPFYYLVRSEDGKKFAHIMCALLDGEDPYAEAEVLPAVPVTDLGPVPDVDIDKLSDSLSTMLTDVGAMAVVLVDRQGNIVQEMGAVGYLDRDRLTSTLAPVFANMVSIGPLVGGKPQAMNFYDGDEFDIFALAVGLHYFICLIFEGSAGSRAFGAVTMFGRRAVQEMLETIGDAAYEYQQPAPAEPAADARPAPRAKTAPAKAARKPEPAPVEPEEEYVPPRPPALDPLPDDADLESVLSGLEQLDLAQADDLFDPDKLAEIASEELAGERLTFEEAQQMGVLKQKS